MTSDDDARLGTRVAEAADAFADFLTATGIDADQLVDLVVDLAVADPCTCDTVADELACTRSDCPDREP